jgi:hypothetical protein
LPERPLAVPTSSKRTPIAAPSIDIPDDLLARPSRPSYFFDRGATRGAVDPETLAPRLPTPLSETLETSFDLAQDQHALAIQDALKDEYATYSDDLEKLTGERPSFNPYSSTTREVRDRRARLTNTGQAPTTSLEDDTISAWHSEVAAIRARHPDAPLLTHDDLIGRVTEARKATRQARARAEGGETGFASGATAVAGGIAGGATDPLLLTTLPFGSPWSAGVLRFALTEAAIGAGTEAVGQAVLQPSRAIVGEEPSLSEAAANVAAAGVGAGILGGAIRGAGKGIAALRSRRARIETVEQALADGRITRTNDLDAALAAERRSLDIEEQNPLGRDVAGMAEHGKGALAAERAINNGEVPHSVPREGLAILPAADRQAVSELLDLANTEPARFAEVVEAIRQTPQEGAETLAQFVRREGGILDRDPAAEAAGLTVEMLPGLVGRGGRPIDDVAAAAAKAGYFPAGTPTRADLVAALTDELHQGRPVTRAGAEAIPPATAALARQASALDRLGIDVRTLAPTEAAARLRAIASTPAAGPQRGVAAGATRAPAESSRLAEGRADGQRAVTAEEQAVELDEVREQTVRDLYAGREDDVTVAIENEDGTVSNMTVRQLFESIEREADEAEALHVCIAGGARKAAAAGGPGFLQQAGKALDSVISGFTR